MSSPSRHPLLAAYVSQLNSHPLRTKAITAGTLCFIQEVVSANVAGTPIRRLSPSASPTEHLLAHARVDSKALKMALYGLLVSAPLGHVLVGALQRIFAGRKGFRARIAQILASNLLVAPIQVAVYLASMAVVNGARTSEDVLRTVRSGFTAVLRVTWAVSPISMVIAQKFISQEIWAPFFNIVNFVVSTYFSIRVKKARLLADKKEKKAKDDIEKDKD